MLERVERAIELGGVEVIRSVAEFGALGKIVRIEGATPTFVAPAGDADTDLSEGGHAGGFDAARRVTARD